MSKKIFFVVVLAFCATNFSFAGWADWLTPDRAITRDGHLICSQSPQMEVRFC